MRKIINDAMPLVDYLWEMVNNNFLVKTPGGRAQAEKFLKKELDKIADPDLKSEFEKEYNSRKFNTWHKWRKLDVASNIKLPDIDYAEIKGLYYVGGITGNAQTNATITNCTNNTNGKITATTTTNDYSYAGGIAGLFGAFDYSIVDSCFNGDINQQLKGQPVDISECIELMKKNYQVDDKELLKHFIEDSYEKRRQLS